MIPHPPAVRFALSLLLLAAAVSVNAAALRHAVPDPFAPVQPADSVTPAPGYLPPDPNEWYRRHDEAVARAGKWAVELAFLGDSLTDGWADAPEAWQVVRGGRTASRFGIPGDTTNNLLWRIGHGLLDGPPPKATIVLIGTNNRKRTDNPSDIAAGVAAVAEAVRAKWPSAKLLLLAIPPEGRWPDDPRRALHAAANARTRAFAAVSGIAFHDCGPALLTTDGELTPEVSDDGTHFTDAGYARLAADLGPVIERALAR